MSLIQAEVNLCNMALGKIGANRITLAMQSNPEGVQCNLIYEQTRNALLRMYDWIFARARTTLTADGTAPDFEWSARFELPSDYIRLQSNYTADNTRSIDDRDTIEGNYILSNDTTIEICYIKKVTDPDDFDPLFKELLVLMLAVRVLYPLAGLSALSLEIGGRIHQELESMMSKAQSVTSAETNVSGRSDWNLARYGSGLV